MYLYCIVFHVAAPISLDGALDFEVALTGRYTGGYFSEEIRGLADATGLDFMVRCGAFYNKVLK